MAASIRLAEHESGIAAICENLHRVGAVVIDLRHVRPRSNDTPTGSNETLASELSSTRRPEEGQLPHFIAKRYVKALITEPSAPRVDGNVRYSERLLCY